MRPVRTRPAAAADRSGEPPRVVIGVRRVLPGGPGPGVRRACDRVIKVLRELGAVVREVSLPHTVFAVPCYYVIAPAEASSNLARYDGVRFGPRLGGQGADVRALYRAPAARGSARRCGAASWSAPTCSPPLLRRLLPESPASAGVAGPGLPQRVRSRRRPAVHPDDADAAFKAGEKLGDPVQMYLSDVFVCTANLTVFPRCRCRSVG